MFVELLKTNQTNIGTSYKIIILRECQHFRYFVVCMPPPHPLLQMLSTCYALACIEKPISHDRLRRPCRLHHKGIESMPSISPYCAPCHRAEGGSQIYNPLLSFLTWGERTVFSTLDNGCGLSSLKNGQRSADLVPALQM